MQLDARAKTDKTRFLAGLSLTHFISDMPFFLLPSILPLIISDFNLNYGQAGAIVTSLLLSMIIVQILTGIAGNHVNRVMIIFLGETIIGCAFFLIFLSYTFWQFLGLQVLIGVGMGFYHPIGYTLISEIFDHNKGKAFGMAESSGIAAAPICFSTTGLLSLYIEWRTIFFVWSIIIFVFTFLSVLFVKRSSMKEISEANKIGSIMLNPRLLKKLAGLLLLMVLSEIGFTTLTSFSSTFLSQKNLGLGYANTLMSLVMIIGIIGSVLMGALSDRYSERRTIFFTTGLIILFSLILLYVDSLVVIIFFLCFLGLPIVGVGPAYFSLISRMTSEKERISVYRIILSIVWGVGGLFPYIDGVLADMFGINIIFAIIFFSALGSLLIVSLIISERRQ